MKLRTFPIAALVIVALGSAACGSAPEPERRPAPLAPVGPIPTQDEVDGAARDFNQIREGFLEWYFEAHPVRATELGVYAYAYRLPVMDRTGVQDRIDDLLEWLSDLEQVRFDLMVGDDRYDYAVLEYGIRSELLELEEARDWANDPGLYTEVIGRALVSVVERDYAPWSTRAGALAARLTAAPDLLEAARTNVRNPPRVWTQMAVEDARGLLDYLRDGLPTELAGRGDTVPVELDRARSRLATGVERHIAWLQNELLPRSTGSFRLGRYLLERKLLYEEHVSLGIDQLDRLNLKAMDQYRQRLTDVAETIDPNRTPRAIIDSIRGTGPSPDELLNRAREALATVRDWTVESGVVPVLRSVLPAVREAPAFSQQSVAGMEGPGPFAPDTLMAYFVVANARPGWDAERVREYMGRFNPADLLLTSLYSAFPGQYVRQQYARTLTPLRRVLATRSFTDGWAHYATEMALDQGFSDDPVLRFEQLQRAMERHALWYAVVRIHAMDEPIDQVITSFMELALVDQATARREVLRATRDPGVIADALGRMQIVELRDDYQEYLAGRDESFSLSDFHEKLLGLGLPFPLAREALMPPERDEGGRARTPGS